MDDATLDELADRPEFTRGECYLWTAPGGFTLFGVYVRELPFGRHRFAAVGYTINTGRHLTELALLGPSGGTQLANGRWRHWDGCPIWSVPAPAMMASCEVTNQPDRGQRRRP